MPGLSRLSIQSKLILLLLAVSLFSIAVMVWIGYASGKTAMRRSIENQLNGMRVAKTTTLQAMLSSLRDQVISLSDSLVVQESTRGFRQAFRELGNQTANEEQLAEIRAFYAGQFLEPLAKQLGVSPVLEQYLPAGPAERYLQYQYLVKNTHAYGQKGDLDEQPSDKSPYGRVHARFHPGMKRIVEIFAFEDLMLIDADTLDIVYSYQKTSEFATNLESGPYADTLLGTKVRSIRGQRDRDDFRIVDFEAYRPSLGKPMGFALSPIFDGPKMIGILALQFPIDKFTEVLTGNFQWESEGFGKTGECYLVGPDLTMRSRSRNMYENPDQFLELLRDQGVATKIVDQIKRQGNVLCVLPVPSASAREALQGRSGMMETLDYRGVPVLSSYGPLELDSLRWGVLAEFDKQEAEEPIRQFGRRVLIAGSATALAVTLLALVFSSLLTSPLRRLAEAARRLGAGDTSVSVDANTHDEFGQLGRVFNEMVDNIRTQREQLEHQVQENQDLLLSILPASAVEQRREGDERASRQFADVSVLFAEIIGMEEFGTKVGEAKALSVLGDLIATFDEAAEKLGIEKVKTIGGSYLAVCGLSVARPDHASRVIQFAQEMSRIVEIFNRDHKAQLHLAVGVNSGPVVGGVVGRRKFLYDLWGDTVTIAKKLAVSDSTAIRLTGPMRERVGDRFQLRGPISVDLGGKQSLEAWEVVKS